MKRIKNSVKMIIALISIFVVAVASVITVIVINNKRGGGDQDGGGEIAYALTPEQTKLVGEINSGVKNSVSDRKRAVLDYNYNSVIPFDEFRYFDDSVIWSGPNSDLDYKVFVINEDGTTSDFMGMVARLETIKPGYTNTFFQYAGKNHFVLYLIYSGSETSITDASMLVLSVENHNLVVNKCIDDLSYSETLGALVTADGNQLSLTFGEDFFVDVSEIDGTRYYEFYEYLADYSDYEPFRLEIDETIKDKAVEILSYSFNIDGKSVVVFKNGKFSLNKSNTTLDPNADRISTIELAGGKITETMKIVPTPETGAELVSGVYYKYSYKFVSNNGVEKTLNLNGLSKISSIIYSGENYFGVFFNSIDENHAVKTKGRISYYDFELNEIASYDANNENSGILYSDGLSLLTKEGMFSTRKQVACSKLLDFSANELTFQTLLENGNFILQDKNYNLYIYNFNLTKAYAGSFDSIVNFVDDKNIIFNFSGSYLLYNITSNTATIINYVSESLSQTTLYFTKDNDKYSLYSGSNLIESNIISYVVNQSNLKITKADETKYYYFSDAKPEQGYLFFAEGVNYSSGENQDNVESSEIYSAGEDISDDSEDDAWYDYRDKITCKTSDSDDHNKAITASHCFQKGYFSATNYYDYLEILFGNPEITKPTGYIPYRVYYKVFVEDGEPKVEIVNQGHIELAVWKMKNQNEISSESFTINGINYKLDLGTTLDSSKYHETNSPWNDSYDYINCSFLGDTVHYAYTADDFNITNDNLKAEVYGNSIKVTFTFNFNEKEFQTKGKILNLGTKYLYYQNVKFGNSLSFIKNFNEMKDLKIDSNLLIESNFYDKLYYKPVVVGPSGSLGANLNFYSDILKNPDYQLMTDYLAGLGSDVKSENLSNGKLPFNGKACNNFCTTKIESAYWACLTQTTFLNAEGELSRLYLGNNVQSAIVGAKLLGITTLNQSNHRNTTYSDLYDTSNDGSRTYFEDVIEFRLFKDGDDEDAYNDDIVAFRYMQYDSELGNYYIDIQNDDYIYYQGGLNKYRFIYLVYEPEQFYLELDYNVSSSEENDADKKDLGNEVDYLKKYAGISIGLNGRNDYNQYNKNWVYKNVSEIDFGDYNNENDNKYEPFNFLLDDSRLEQTDTSTMNQQQLIAYEHSLETSALIYELKRDGERYFYIKIDGVKYYIQRNYVDGNKKYSTPYYEFIEGSDGAREEMFLVASRKKSKFDAFNDPNVQNYGAITFLSETEYKSKIIPDKYYYEQGDEELYVRIALDQNGKWSAYYHQKNVHTRSASYVGHYSYAADGTTLSRDESEKTYSITEKFSFLYTDNVLFTQSPVHSHYDFIGWKVYLGDYDTKLIVTSELSASGEQINCIYNSANNKYYYLAGGSSIYYQIWRQTTGADTEWFNNENKPIRLVAQWKPAECSINAVLWVKDADGNHIAYNFTQRNGVFEIHSNYVISPSSYTPILTIDGNNIDQFTNPTTYGAPDGIVDEIIKFEYSQTITFEDIGRMLSGKGYNSGSINSTGLNSQFANWCFQNVDSKFITVDSNIEEEKAKTKIEDYIGDTTVISVYAYYSTARYDFNLIYNPLGGAQSSKENKDYYNTDDEIYNTSSNPVIYDITVTDAQEQDNVRKFTSGTPSDDVSGMTIQNLKNYVISFNNQFYAGNSINIATRINNQYYLKQIVVSNLVLKNNSGMYDTYKLTFSYMINAEGNGVWSATAVGAKTGALTVTPNGDGFIIGSTENSKVYNSDHNFFSIQQQTESETIGGKTYYYNIYTALIKNLADPGTLNYDTQKLTGSLGFTMEYTVESYTIDTEKVTITNADNDGTDVIKFNRSMMISSQPLTNLEGKTLKNGENSFIFLGTAKYFFRENWNGTATPGYYKIASNGVNQAQYAENYTYDAFITQEIKFNGDLFVYYDDKTNLIYYPVQSYAEGGGQLTQSEQSVTLKRGNFGFASFQKYSVYVEIDRTKYYIYDKYKSDSTTLDQTFSNGYYLFKAVGAFYNTIYQKTFTGVTVPVKVYTHYRSLSYSADEYESSIYKSGCLIFYGRLEDGKVYYHNEEKEEINADFKVGYNNTRILTIDPEQDNIYLSSNPNTSNIFTDRYELRYYLSSLVIGGNTFTFEKLTRDITIDEEKHLKTYGYFNLNYNAKGAGTDYAMRYVDSFGQTINYMGDVFTIHDGYILTIPQQDNRVGATKYVFYIARNNEGFTKYFLIYDEETTMLTSSSLNYEISIEFKKYLNTMEIDVDESDLYDVSNRSFDIKYSENDANTNFISYDLNTETTFDNVGENIDGHTFYENIVDGGTVADLNNRVLSSLSWKNTIDFYPSMSRKLQISATNGYIINKLIVSIGKISYFDSESQSQVDNEFTQDIVFKINPDSSFENLIYSPELGSYSYTSILNNSYNLNLDYEASSENTNYTYGYELVSDSDYKHGLYYSYNGGIAWNFGSENKYSLEEIFLLLSGLYEDVKIEIETISYSEFIFEKGEGDYNPLLKGNITSTESGKSYKNLSLLDDTYLDIFTNNYNADETLFIDDSIENDESLFYLRYYPRASLNNIQSGTLRLMFFGTGSKIKYGLHILATHEDYSVYFTNGRYYFEKMTDNTDGYDSFKNLENYSGRTSNDKKIEVNQAADINLRGKSNKLVYMHTGELWKSGYTGYFKDGSYKETEESNFKFMLAVRTFVNRINVNTDSYLYNDNITKQEGINGSSTTSSFAPAGERSVYYKFIQNESGDDYRVALGDNINNLSIYQLDNKTKTKSWFNDVVLSNIQYNSYLDKDGSFRTWANRNGDKSQISSQEMTGFDFSWTYYEIAGYYLKYILIEIADLNKYYAINVDLLLQGRTLILSNGYLRLDEPISISVGDDNGGYNYNFNLFYEVSYGDQKTACIKFYPVGLSGDDGSTIDKLKSVSLMSNNIKVAFISNARTYNINYKNYTYDGSVSSASTTKIGSNLDPEDMWLSYNYTNTYSQTIYYDSLTQLNRSETMSGYTFIGWGSETYYDDSQNVSRFKKADNTSMSSIWNTQSSWFNPTNYFVQEGKTAEENALLYSDLFKKYEDTVNYPQPGSAFYVNGGYFMTDTGNSSGSYVQNYNFFANYINVFSKYIGNLTSSDSRKSLDISLYGIFKANTYTIEFDVNNAYGDNYYLDYGDETFTSDFTSDKIGFRTRIAYTETVNGSTEVKYRTKTYTCYVTFDTNNWYFLDDNGQKIIYSFMGEPYIYSSMSEEGNQSKIVVDMFGYSWLGWYYTNLGNKLKQGDTIPIETLVLNSLYLKNKGAGKKEALPVFNDAFIEPLRNNNAIFDESVVEQDFVYYRMHLVNKSLSAQNGYVYFYDYSTSSNYNAENTSDFGQNYVSVIDFLNTFQVDDKNNMVYSQISARNNILLSYYDTCLSKNSYKVVEEKNNAGFSLGIDKSLENIRRIKLFANWSMNKYTTIFDRLDGSNNDSVDHTGSGSAQFTFVSNSYYFNDINLAKYLINTTQPSRVGYDFVGWSFNYVLPNGNYSSLASTINVASPVLYLCKELFIYYAALNGAENTNSLESNVLMVNGNRIIDNASNDWILNEDGMAERLGDGEDERYRYVYIFPVWRVQSFSINISLNITKENLDNLYEKDSSFAINLYNNSERTNYTGVNSNYYTYTKTKANYATNYSYYNSYYNDIVANVCFTIDFDQPLSTAKLTFAGRTYYLKDLAMTSAGYYFLGLMYENTYNNDNDYVVKNTLNSVLKLGDGLVDENNDGEINTIGVFDIDAYNNYYRTKHANNKDSSSDYSKLSSNDYVSSVSSNFGTIRLSAYNYDKLVSSYRTFNIMSETVGSENYLFIIHNNVKYYVVYYLMYGSSFVNNITFDRTFLYYNEKDDSGRITNSYIIRFDINNKAYYVKNGFISKVDIYNPLRIALYATRRNTLATTVSGSSESLIYYNTDKVNGSILGQTTSYASDIGPGATYTLTNKTTREFTLYANWQKRDVVSTIANGNNVATGSISPDKNRGLAGNYSISSGSNSSKTSLNNGDTQLSISLSHKYYTNASYSFLPYYNGRYISEIAVEFDTIVETGNGNATQFSMEHNTVVFRFDWTSSEHSVTISSVTVNGTIANNVVDSRTISSDYKANLIKNISILSMIDYYSLNDTSSKSSAINIYGFGRGNMDGRTDINPVTLTLNNVMCDVKFTCKYSVQTYLVEVYNVVGDVGLTKSGNKYKTTFSSLDAMLQSSNYLPANRGSYNDPYISSSGYSTGIMSTISSNCAIIPTTSYNVPYYYFVTSSASDYTIDSNIANLSSGYYGFNYVYNGYYRNGNLGDTAKQYSGSLNTILAKMSSYEDQGWFTYAGVDSGSNVVTLETYTESTPIVQDTTIYGYFINKDAPVKVLFYYWDNNAGRYVQYMNNVNEYNSNTTKSNGGKIEKKADGYHITELPSPSIAPWLGDSTKQFLGYVYISAVVHGQFVEVVKDEKYDGVEFEASNSFKETRGEIYSAISMNKLAGINYKNASAYTSVLSSFSITDMFKYRITVYDDNYYTSTASVSQIGTSVLDSVRANIYVDINGTKYAIHKDLKMLNVGTAIPNNTTVYAIPIYEDVSLKFTGEVNAYNGNVTITSNRNMIQSNVFETNSNYTIYYNPKDVRVAISSSSTKPTLTQLANYYSYLNSNTATNNRYFTLDEVVRGDSDNSDSIVQVYGMKNIKVNSSFYLYLYYVKNGVPFYVSSNYLYVYQSKNTRDVKIDIYDSPLDVDLNSTNLNYYYAAADKIDVLGETDENTYNRKKLIYIALQLLQTGLIEIDTEKNADYLYGFNDANFTVDVGNSGGGNYDVTSAVSLINNIQNGITSTNKIHTDQAGFFRLIYTLAYYYTDKQKIYSSNGLRALFGNIGQTALSFDNIDSTLNASSFTDKAIKPGDILKDDRSAKTFVIEDVYNANSNVTINLVENVGFTMFLYSTSTYIYYLTETGIKFSSVSTDFKKFSEDKNDNNKYEYFEVGEGDGGYFGLNNDKTTVIGDLVKYDGYKFNVTSELTVYCREIMVNGVKTIYIYNYTSKYGSNGYYYYLSSDYISAYLSARNYATNNSNLRAEAEKNIDVDAIDAQAKAEAEAEAKKAGDSAKVGSEEYATEMATRDATTAAEKARSDKANELLTANEKYPYADNLQYFLSQYDTVDYKDLTDDQKHFKAVQDQLVYQQEKKLYETYRDQEILKAYNETYASVYQTTYDKYYQQSAYQTAYDKKYNEIYPANKNAMIEAAKTEYLNDTSKKNALIDSLYKAKFNELIAAYQKYNIVTSNTPAGISSKEFRKSGVSGNDGLVCKVYNYQEGHKYFKLTSDFKKIVATDLTVNEGYDDGNYWIKCGSNIYTRFKSFF